MVEVTEILGRCIIGAFAVFLMALGVAAFAQPRMFGVFLSGFAQSARAHFLEMTARFLVGASFLACAGSVFYEVAFEVFGWLLLVTTGVLVLVPWKLHQRFARMVVPRALEYTPFIGATSIGMGILVVFSLTSGGEI